MKVGDAAHATKFVNLLRLKFSPSTSRFNTTFTSTTNCIKFKPDSALTTLLKSKKNLHLPFSPPRSFNFQPPLTATANYLRFSGSGIILGLSVASASAATVAHAMDAGDALVDDPRNDSRDPSDKEQNVHQLWNFTRKFWLPVFFFLTVLSNLDDPFTILFIKVTLFLLSTKPNPFSVYIFVDQLCQKSVHQQTQFFKKSLYASKVEVQDYKLLCLADVVVGDQKFTLIGILGTWWTLPKLPSRETFTLVRNRLGSILRKTTGQGMLQI